MSVLRRLSRLDMLNADLLLLAPFLQISTDELRPVIDP